LKVTAIAHPIQGLIKYHGLKDPTLRIPFHDSISVCSDALETVTTVNFDKNLSDDYVIINEERVIGADLERIMKIVRKLAHMANNKDHFKIVSKNNLLNGKGLGFSASGFAALGFASRKALELDIDDVSFSEIVRLGAGSATRSLAGGFSIWYADRDNRSYAEQLAGPDSMDFMQVVIPIASDVKTDEAHIEVLSSPLFKVRLEHIDEMLASMRAAIACKDVGTIGRLAEEDTLNLHAITMTGKSHIVLWEPDTIRILKEVLRMRAEGVSAWYSMNTGPSVFVNTVSRHVKEVARRIAALGFSKVIVSKVGSSPSISDEHLF
jgi:phosphomevalonate decarboxylase